MLLFPLPPLKKLYTYLREFIAEDFEWKSYSLAAFCMTLALYFNYYSPLKGNYYSLEERFSVYFANTPAVFVFYAFFYFIPYVLVLAAKLALNRHWHLFFKPELIIKLAFIFTLLSLDGGFYFGQNLLEKGRFAERNFVNQLVNQSFSFGTYAIPIILFYLIFERNIRSFAYGLSTRHFELRPYLYMLGFMAILVAGASFTDDFQSQYPSISPMFLTDVFGMPKALLVALFEMIYLLDFINVELVFRGFLIIGLSSLLGRHALLPCCMAYMMLHFEKPVAEAVGSIFGGYILGVFALRSHSIWGGFLLHMGTAALMELFAYCQIYVSP